MRKRDKVFHFAICKNDGILSARRWSKSFRRNRAITKGFVGTVIGKNQVEATEKALIWFLGAQDHGEN